MRIQAVLVILLVGVMSAVATNTPDEVGDSTAPRGPLLEFPDGRELNMGLIRAGELATDSIRVHNAGDEPLVLTSVYADCSCTMPRYPKTPIQPGDDAYISVTYDPGSRKSGGILKILRVRTNDNRGQKKIFLKAEIRRPTRNE